MSDNYIYPLYKTSSNSDTTWDSIKRIIITQSIDLVPEYSFYYIVLQSDGRSITVKPPASEDDRVGFTVKFWLEDMNGYESVTVRDRLDPSSDPEDESYVIEYDLQTSRDSLTLMWMGDSWSEVEFNIT